MLVRAVLEGGDGQDTEGQEARTKHGHCPTRLPQKGGRCAARSLITARPETQSRRGPSGIDGDNVMCSVP